MPPQSVESKVFSRFVKPFFPSSCTSCRPSRFCSTKASATQSTLPTWASKDGYHSDCTAVTAASRTSPERSNDIDISGSKADISLRRGVSSNEAVGGALTDCPGARSTPVARGDREREGERNWERCRPREERKGGARERRREENEIFSITQRYGYSSFLLRVSSTW